MLCKSRNVWLPTSSLWLVLFYEPITIVTAGAKDAAMVVLVEHLHEGRLTHRQQKGSRIPTSVVSHWQPLSHTKEKHPYVHFFSMRVKHICIFQHWWTQMAQTEDILVYKLCLHYPVCVKSYTLNCSWVTGHSYLNSALNPQAMLTHTWPESLQCVFTLSTTSRRSLPSFDCFFFFFSQTVWKSKSVLLFHGTLALINSQFTTVWGSRWHEYTHVMRHH